MEEENWMPAEERQYCSNWPVMSPEIVEIEEGSTSMIGSRDGGMRDVFVAVGKNDLDVVKWALDHAVSPGARVFLVHIFPTLAYIPTPVGSLSRSQLSRETLQIYINEENNRRRNLLQKYIQVFTDAKVVVETMLVESNATAKTILDLISVVNITNLVMGTKRPPFSWRLMKGLGKEDIVQRNAPDFCEVTIIYNGKKVKDGQKLNVIKPLITSAVEPNSRRSDSTRKTGRKIFDCICLPGKFNCIVRKQSKLTVLV